MYREKLFIRSRITTFFFIIIIIFFAELIDVLFLSTLQDFFKINEEILDIILAIAVSVPFIFWIFRDQNIAEEKIRENEERFRSVIQTANDAIIIADDQGKIISWNGSAKEMFGYGSNEIIGESLSVLMPEKYRYSLNKMTEPGPKDSKMTRRTLEFSGLRKDKTEFPLELSFSTWITTKGRFYTGIIRDITERKREQEISMKSLMMLEKALEMGKMGTWEWIIATNDLILSDETIKLYGLDRRTDHQDHGLIVNSLAPQCRDNFLKDIASTIDSGQPFSREYCKTNMNGTKKYTHTKGELFRDKEGIPLKMYGIVQDITEQKHSEEKVMLFRNLIDRSNDAIFVNDPESGLILDANERACINLGYTKEELLQMHVMDIENKFTDQLSWDEHYRDVRSKGHMIIEGRQKRKDGTVYPVEANVSFIDLGKNSYMVAIVRDITERNEINNHIIHSLREKETLLREIHHRVKNNMQIISSLLGLQSNYVREERYIEMFRDSRNRINSMSLIHEKLYRSKDLVKIEFKEYVRDLTDGLFQSHGTSMGRVELDIDIDEVSIGIDHALTCGLIINELITNSLKYAFKGRKTGKIRISLRAIEKEGIELTVSDNGVGIPPEVDFRKTESLGLRLVIMLAENQLHGKIDLDASKGTEFKITFKGDK